MRDLVRPFCLRRQIIRNVQTIHFIFITYSLKTLKGWHHQLCAVWCTQALVTTSPHFHFNRGNLFDSRYGAVSSLKKNCWSDEFFFLVYTTYSADNIFTFLGADIRFLYWYLYILHGGDSETWDTKIILLHFFNGNRCKRKYLLW